MRLPFPEHIPLRYAGYFATLLWVAQYVQGTSPAFSVCCFFFILVATLAFNLAGGLTRCSGVYVFFYSVNAIILGLFWKAVLGEPADSNLTHPLLTIEAELGGIVAMWGSIFISRRFTKEPAFLDDLIPERKMLHASIGCAITGTVLTALLWFIPYQSGSLLSSLAQLNHFFEISILLGVIYQIRKSGGTSSVNLTVLTVGCISFVAGVFTFSKQGMFTPPVCWLLAAASQRYRVSLAQIVSFILVATFTVYYLVPYSQYGRNYMTESRLENIGVSISFLSDLGSVRQQYLQESQFYVENRVQGYFDTGQGLIDRIVMVSLDDAIINVTEDKGPFGLAPIVIQFENLVPHFLWPGKPTINFGNLYAHEVGMVAPDDITTGVSFSPIGEAFRVGRWMGIFLVAPVIWIMLFTLYDSLCGDIRRNVWGLLGGLLLAHMAPNGLLGGIIYMLGYGTAAIIFVALTASYLMPVLGGFFAGRESVDLRRVGRVRSIPRRQLPIPSMQAPQSTTGSPPAV